MAAVALLSAPPAAGVPTIENTWGPTGFALGFEDLEAWETVMASSGKGVAFYDRWYRDYDAVTNTWGPKKILHVASDRMVASGNSAGTACTAWNADFGAAFACRSANSTAWVKKNLSMNSGAVVHSIAVSHDGKRALIVWADLMNGASKPRATIYALASQTLSTTNMNNIPFGGTNFYLTAATRLGGKDGFTLMYVTGSNSLDVRTYYRLYRPGQGWTAQTRVKLATGGGVPQDVMVWDLESDGRRAYFAATTDIAAATAVNPAAWWIVGVTSTGTLTAPQDPQITMRRPVLAASGSSVTMAGFNGVDALTAATTHDFINSPLITFSMLSPPVADTMGRLTYLQAVGQRDAQGAHGFTIVAQYTGISNPGEEFEDDVDKLFTMVGFPMAGGANLSSLTPLGNLSGYEGMAPDLSGYGRYAMTVYASGLELYAGVRRPQVI